jgi:hypothetical protein
MSKVQLSGNVSGTGVFTIASPNSNTDRTLTLPDSSGTIGLSGAAVTRSQLPAGTVLQVVNAITGAYTGVTSTTYQAITNLTATITPTSASSRVLIIVSIGEFRCPGNVGARINIFKNGSSLACIADELGYDGSGAASPTYGLSFASSFVDVPGTTSATTYAIFARKLVGNSGDAQFLPNGITFMSIQLLEIAV